METFSYTVPTERVDNVPLPLSELDFITFEFKLSTDTVWTNATADGTIDGSHSFALPATPGTYDIRCKAVDTDGRNSVFSNVVQRTVAAPLQPPKPPVLT